jgi:murein DD-endopeptidase MepM/ murein hydrolase activator NlpD
MTGDEIAIGILLLLVLLGSGGGHTAVTPLPRLAWTWPIPTLDPGVHVLGRPIYPAAVSNEYQGDHIGQDICYRRDAGSKSTTGRRAAIAWAQRYKPGTAQGTSAFFCPSGTPVLAAAQGQVATVQAVKSGMAVVIDHGGGWSTMYLHLSAVAVKEGDTVAAGQRIGTVGADPQDPEGFNHLHFAIRYRGNPVLPTGQAQWRRVVWKL